MHLINKEPLINKEFGKLPPVTIPHHKGRKRMHLEIKENLVKMGSDIKEKFIKSIWNSVNNFVGKLNKIYNCLSGLNYFFFFVYFRYAKI